MSEIDLQRWQKGQLKQQMNTNRNNFLQICKDCWGMPKDQFAQKGKCLSCWGIKKTGDTISNVLWKKELYFREIESILWDKLWDVIKTVGKEWVLFNNKFTRVWWMSWAFRWVKKWIGPWKIDEQYDWAYSLQKSSTPIPLLVARSMIVDLYTEWETWRKLYKDVWRKKKWVDRTEEFIALYMLFTFISNHRKYIKRIDEWDWDDDVLWNMLELQKRWIEQEDIRYIKEEVNFEYEKIQHVLAYCRLKYKKLNRRNRWTRGRTIFNLPSVLTCDDWQREEQHEDYS